MSSATALVSEDGAQKYPIFGFTKVAGTAGAEFGGANYLVASGGFKGYIGANIVSTQGKVVGTETLSKAGVATVSDLDVSFDGTNHLVVWNDPSKPAIHGLLVDTTGKAVGKEFLVEGGGGVGLMTRPRVVHGNGKYLVVWEDKRSAGIDVIGALVNPTPNLGSKQVQQKTIQIAAGSTSQQRPRLTFANGRFFVVWDQGGVRASQVKLTGSGAVVKAEVVHTPTLSLLSGTSDFYPDVAHSGGKVVVTWRSGSAVQFTLIEFGT